MKKQVLIAAALLCACSSGEILYRPRPQTLPQHIKKLSIRTFINKTPKFGLEDRLTLTVSNEFLKSGQYAVTSENEAQGVILGEIKYYVLTPIEYDVNMVPSVYKLNIVVSVSLLDKTANRILWNEPALQATKIYSAPTLPGGLTEEQAQELLWELLAKDIVKRTVEGFGAATSASEKKLPSKNLTRDGRD